MYILRFKLFIYIIYHYECKTLNYDNITANLYNEVLILKKSCYLCYFINYFYNTVIYNIDFLKIIHTKNKLF